MHPQQVLQNDPVFTPCHHTFCGDCIRGRLAEGNNTCAECHKPLKAEELQSNTMALNLLNSLKATRTPRMPPLCPPCRDAS